MTLWGYDLWSVTLAFARIGALVMLMPGLGEAAVPARVRLGFAMLLSIMLAPQVASAPEDVWGASGIVIGEKEVHLGLVDMPVLNIYAEQDHLVPPAASKALRDLVGTDDYTELGFRGGHIGIYVSSRAQTEVPQTIHDWLAQRSR